MMFYKLRRMLSATYVVAWVYDRTETEMLVIVGLSSPEELLEVHGVVPIADIRRFREATARSTDASVFGCISSPGLPAMVTRPGLNGCWANAQTIRRFQ